MIVSMGISLGVTLLVEGLVAILLGLRHWKELRLVVLVNLLTNPATVYFSYLGRLFGGVRIGLFVMAVAELFAFWAEGYCYQHYLDWIKKNGYLLSLLLNGASFCVGMAIKFG